MEEKEWLDKLSKLSQLCDDWLKTHHVQTMARVAVRDMKPILEHIVSFMPTPGLFELCTIQRGVESVRIWVGPNLNLFLTLTMPAGTTPPVLVAPEDLVQCGITPYALVEYVKKFAESAQFSTEVDKLNQWTLFGGKKGPASA